jgi:DNA-directed RNA polymerase subunit RPC12/RpoP
MESPQEESIEIRCPYCNSRDLSKVPTQAGESAESTSVTYRCQMCTRTFSKTVPPDTAAK